MKRSEVESYVEWARGLIKDCGMKLPGFGYWTIDDWKTDVEKKDRMIRSMLGWDITDYGMGDFLKIGSVLFTIRNGVFGDSSIGTPYAEKLLPTMDGQRLPLHFHYSKCEDIINRGGGDMWIKLYNSKKDESVDYESDVTVYMDGLAHTVAAGDTLIVKKGESISLTPGMYHTFGAVEGRGDLLVGEVSSINDDNVDNHFAEEVRRFAKIVEDVPIRTPLMNEYDEVLR